MKLNAAIIVAIVLSFIFNSVLLATSDLQISATSRLARLEKEIARAQNEVDVSALGKDSSIYFELVRLKNSLRDVRFQMKTKNNAALKALESRVAGLEQSFRLLQKKIQQTGIKNRPEQQPLAVSRIVEGESTFSISGTVTAAATGDPLFHVYVGIFGSDGFVTSGYTDENGFYSIGSLAAGTYYAWAQNDQGYANELYNDMFCDNSCTTSNGTPIHLDDSNATDVNFAFERAGSVSGTVSDAVTHEPIPGVWLVLTHLGDDGTSTASTDASGNYTVYRLRPGNYHVRTYYNSGGYVNELYNDIVCQSWCDQAAGEVISVSSDNTTGGINFELDKGGIVSGTVTDAVTGNPISNVQVYNVDQSGIHLQYVFTDSFGKYILKGIVPGSYYLKVNSAPQGYMKELYDNVPCDVLGGCGLNKGTLVSVSQNTETPNINFALSTGGSLSGRVTDAVTNAPISGVTVAVTDANGNWLSKFTDTDVNGDYSITGLAPGTYHVFTKGSFAYVDELYSNIPCQNWCDTTVGTPIVVQNVENQAGIDFALGKGGSFSGIITDATTLVPLADVEVQISQTNYKRIRSVFTNSLGQFNSGALATNSYVASTSAPLYINEIYNNILCQPYCAVVDGTPIAVTDGVNTPGIDFALELGGSISGTVTDADTNLPIPNAPIYISDSINATSGMAYSDTSGNYTAGGLFSGTYYAHVDDHSGAQAYIGEIYDNILCMPPWMCGNVHGNPIPVVQKDNTAGINFTLTKGGSISGKVTDSVTNAPVPNVSVRVFDGEGNPVSSGFTTEGGIYKAQALASGTYYVIAMGWEYLTGLYDQLDCSEECHVTSGTPVVVDVGVDTPGIDFSLIPSNSLFGDDFVDGSISGTWTEKGGTWYVNDEAATATTSKRADAISPDFGGCEACSFGTTLHVSEGGRISLIGWYTSSSNQMEVRLMQDKQKLLIIQRGAGLKTKVSVPMTILPDIDYSVLATYEDGKFRIIVDGETVATLNAIAKPFGVVKLRVKKGSASSATGAFQFVEVR